MKRILCAVCVSLIGWQALAGDVDDNLKKLEDALQKSGAEQGNSPADSKSQQQAESSANIMRDLSHVREQLASDRLNGAIGKLEQFKRETLSEDARKSVDELLGTLKKELDARLKEAQAPFSKLMMNASDSVKKAKIPSDLDAVLHELGEVKKRGEFRVSDVIISQVGEAESAYAFVAGWQEYLAAKAGGYGDEARTIARTLANSSTLLLPRSELLAKAYETKKETPPTPQLSPAK